MYYRTIQKPKKWFKPKRIKLKTEMGEKYQRKGFKYVLVEVVNDERDWSSYGGIDHTNRDRKNGHVQTMIKDYTREWPDEIGWNERKFVKRRERRNSRRNSKRILKEELDDYYEDRFWEEYYYDYIVDMSEILGD